MSVWQTQGFDADRIRDLSQPQDKRSHPVLGDTYRVRILTVGTKGERGQQRTSTCRAKRQPEIGDEGDGAPEKKKVKSRASSEDSSSSSSSSSSSTPKKSKKKDRKKQKKDAKRKKDKKSKKEKKDKERAKLDEKTAKEAEQTKQRQLRLQVKAAQTILNKLEGPCKSLEDLTVRPLWQQVPDVMRSKLEKTMRGWRNIMDKALIAVDGVEIVNLPDPKDSLPLSLSLSRVRLQAAHGFAFAVTSVWV